MADLFTEYAGWLQLLFGLIGAIAVGVGMYISIRKYRMDRRKDNTEQREYFAGQISASEGRIKEVVTLKVENIDTKIDNIEDILTVQDGTSRSLKTTIDVLGKQITELEKKVIVMEVKIPELDTLKEAFYKLKSNFDKYMAAKTGMAYDMERNGV